MSSGCRHRVVCIQFVCEKFQVGRKGSRAVARQEHRKQQQQCEDREKAKRLWPAREPGEEVAPRQKEQQLTHTCVNSQISLDSSREESQCERGICARAAAATTREKDKRMRGEPERRRKR